MMKSLMCIFFLYLSTYSALIVEKINETFITKDAFEWRDSRYGNLYLNSLSFQQDAIITFNGWQYAVYYSSSRHVAVARREISSESWENLELTDYKQTTDDNHNSISIGVSPADGRIHLSFDHHTAALHYRISKAGLLSNPKDHKWEASLFSEVQSKLDGESVTGVTYPRFITAPDSTLVLTVRIGTSGDSDNRIWKYNNDGTWHNLGQFVEGNYKGGTCTAYFHGLKFDKNNKLHAAWCWREDGSGEMNHDLLYAYSDDYGATWYNNQNSVIARAGKSFITQDTTSCKVWTIATSTGLINQESMTLDNQGRVHILSRENISQKNIQMHYFRDTTGVWHRINTTIATKIWDNRSKIVSDGANNVYAIMPHISIAGASSKSGYTDWSVLSTVDENRFYYSEPLVDVMHTGKESCNLYIFAQKGFRELQNWKNVTNISIGQDVMTVDKNAYCEGPSAQWTNYAFKFSLKIKEIAAGVCFRVQDSSNLYMWQINASTGLLRFHVKKSGTWTVLKETQFTLQANTEYQAAIVADGTKFLCIINDQKVDSVTDASFEKGTIGFKSGKTESFIIDNVSVTSDNVLFSDLFSSQTSLTSPEIMCLEYQLNADSVSTKIPGDFNNAVKGYSLINKLYIKRDRQNAIFYDMPERSDLFISIYDIKGCLVKNIRANNVLKGMFTITINDHAPVSGIYLIRMRVNDCTGRKTEFIIKTTELLR